MNDEEKLKYWIALSLIPGVGDVLAKNLVSYCGDAKSVFSKKKKDLIRIPGVGPQIANEIIQFADFKTAEKECSFIRKHNLQAVSYPDDDYPQRLKNCADGPILIFCCGEMNLNAERMIAVIGTRRATDYGNRMVEKMVSGLAKYDATIVSGLALGIDIAAHRCALDHQLQTIGVLAHGLNRIYPGQHKATAKKMLEHGGLITEFKSMDKFNRENFPKRNRIIAGVSDAVLVIESQLKGGALITAEIANSYNRDVFAIPGRSDDDFSSGCNFLIKSNKASLVESAEDIAFFMNWEKNPGDQNVQKKLFIELSEDEKAITSLLAGNAELHVDEISSAMQWTGSKLAAVLLSLEINGVVKSMPGKLYKLS